MTSNNMSFVGVDPSTLKESSVRNRFREIAENPTYQETLPELIKRNIGQQTARTLETVTGYPGNFKKAMLESREMLERSLFPEGETLSELEEKTFGKPKRTSAEGILMQPPTSKELRETVTKKAAEKLGGDKEYFEPKSDDERLLGELNQNITSFFLPGTGGMRMLTRIGAPIAGMAAGETAKFLGAPENVAESVKNGFMLATTLAGQSNPGQHASHMIRDSKAMIPQSAQVNVLPLANRLMPLYNRMVSGLRVPSKTRAVQGMQELAQQSQNGRMSLRSLMDARDNINEWISEAGGWDVPVNTRDAGIRNLNELKRAVIETIDENLAQNYPQVRDLYNNGYQAAAINHRSNAVSNFIERHFGRKIASVGAKVLFPSLAGGAAILPKTAAGATALYPIYKTGQVLYRVANSPILARYYQDVISQSVRGNVPGMINSMQKLDNALLEEEKKEGKGIKKDLSTFKQKFKGKG